MIKESMFVIAVPDLKKSAAFYQDVLGFQIAEIGDGGWRMYMRVIVPMRSNQMNWVIILIFVI